MLQKINPAIKISWLNNATQKIIQSLWGERVYIHSIL
jgi:hypothetical protein